MTEPRSEGGSGGATVPPPPPWLQPPRDTAAPAEAAEAAPAVAEPAVPGVPVPPPGPIGRSATEVLPQVAAPAPQAPAPAPAPASSRAVPQTVTVSSGAPFAAGAVTAVPPPRLAASGNSRKPMLAVAAALVFVLLVGIGLVVFQRGSQTTSANPVSGPATQVGGDDSPPPEDTQPTTPPTTAPPTTQALPPATVVTRITTTDPVVFITIDDGWHVPPEARARLVSGNLPVTTFLLSQVLDKDPALWKELDTSSGSVENHSISHPNFSKLTLEQQQDQICSASQDIASKLGQFPTMFRPPYGATNANTVIAAGNCGIKYVVKWGASVNNAKVTFASGSALRPGDIVLMHYRPELAGDLDAVMKAAEFAGLKPALLSDYLK